MAEEVHGKFQCVLLTPSARLLDCKARSVTLPAYDGQMGIWRNHMPMLCKLGLGIMDVRDLITDDDPTPNDTCFLIDGGLVRISNNVVTVLAYDVISSDDLDTTNAERMRDAAVNLPGDSAQVMQQRQHDIEKSLLLMELARKSAVLKNRQGIRP
jgi:ATP synthase F1 epsilon subunit